MFYISKVSPLLFVFGFLNLVLSLILKLAGTYGTLFFVVLVFGFVGSILLGAMYQIIPNSQNRKLSLPQISYLVFAGVVASFLMFYGGLHSYGSLLLAVSYTTFFVHTLLNVKNFMPVTVKFLGVSAFYLALSSVLLALHFNLGAVPLQLAVHSLTLGAMLNAVYGVEIAWVPMLLMETLNVRKAQRLFYAKQVVTPLILVSFYLLNYQAIALLSLGEIAVSLYFIYLLYLLIKQRRMPSPIPYVVKTFLIALFFLPLGLLMGTITASAPQALHKLFLIHIDIVLYGFTAFTIFGGIAHLLPRIMWNWKFASRKDGPVPSINELIDEKAFPEFLERAVFLFALFVAVDALFEPINRLSVFIYAFIIALFVRITFVHLLKKLREVSNGSNKALGEEV